MSQIISLEDYQNKKVLKAAVGDGRGLALNSSQSANLFGNAKNKVVEFQKKIQENASLEINVSNPVEEKVLAPETAEVAPVLDSQVVESAAAPLENAVSDVVSLTPEVPTPVESEVNLSASTSNISLESEPVFIAPQMPVSENAVIDNNPVSSADNVLENNNMASEESVLSSIIEPSVVKEESVIAPGIDVTAEPVIAVPTEPAVEEQAVVEEPLENKVEIVSNSASKSDYENLIEQINLITQEYDKKIIDLNNERNQKINELLEKNKVSLMEKESQIIDLANKAEEHLKNAKAAEEIAHIAQNNAQNVQKTLAA